MTAMRIGVLADDLSGALASAAALRHHGLSTAVQWDRSPPEPELDAVVVDMRTRDHKGSAEQHTACWAAWLTDQGADQLELRIDSTLRSKTTAELRGLMTGAQLTDAWILAVPACPQAGRVTRDGLQHIDGGNGGRPLRVAQRLFDDSAGGIGLDVIDAGPSAVVDLMTAAADRGIARFVADAEHDGHLRTLALAAGRVRRAGQSLVTLSPGAWLRHHPADVSADDGVVVVVLGSATDVNREALSLLRRQTSTALIDACGRFSSDHVLGTTRVAVVETIRAGDAAGADRLSRRAAGVAAELLNRFRDDNRAINGLIVSGGHTAACLLEHLRPVRLQPLGELAPLCPLGTLVGGPWSGLPLITKGGLIGTPRTLSDLAVSLTQENPCPTPDLASR